MMAVNNLTIIQVYKNDLQQRFLSHLWTLNNHKSQVTCMSVSDDGGLAVSGSMDRTLVLWNLLNGQALRKIEVQNQVSGCMITSGGKFVAATLARGFYMVYEVHTNVIWRTGQLFGNHSGMCLQSDIITELAKEGRESQARTMA